MELKLNYDAPATVGRFMSSAAFGRLLAGPIGSGKTTGCIMELLRRAAEQAPAPDGFKYTRFAIVRQTLKQIKDTVLRDITSLLRGIAHWKVSESTIYVQVGKIRSEWMLIPLENMEDQRRLLSMQLTGAWINEAIEIDISLLDPLAGRIGRYPNATLGGCTWKGIIIDTNMPEEGSEWHKFMEDPPPDWQPFIQPGGMSPDAENLPWLNQNSESYKLPVDDPVRIALGRAYYERLLGSALGYNWVKRYVHALYGDDPSGMAVFGDSFVREFHVTDKLIDGKDYCIELSHGYPILIGQDFGRDPWSIICQPNHKGQLLVVDEVPATNIGLEQHILTQLRPKLMDFRYIGRPIAVSGDPSGRNKSSLYEETSFDLMKRNGLPSFAAPTNDLDPRLRAVEHWLLQQRGGQPAILIDGVRCPNTVRALAGGYKFEKMKSGQRKPTPMKNDYSHVMDALQYACLTALGGQWQSITRKLTSYRQTRPQAGVPTAAWT